MPYVLEFLSLIEEKAVPGSGGFILDSLERHHQSSPSMWWNINGCGSTCVQCVRRNRRRESHCLASWDAEKKNDKEKKKKTKNTSPFIAVGIFF